MKICGLPIDIWIKIISYLPYMTYINLYFIEEFRHVLNKKDVQSKIIFLKYGICDDNNVIEIERILRMNPLKYRYYRQKYYKSKLDTFRKQVIAEYQHGIVFNDELIKLSNTEFFENGKISNELLTFNDKLPTLLRLDIDDQTSI